MGESENKKDEGGRLIRLNEVLSVLWSPRLAVTNDSIVEGSHGMRHSISHLLQLRIASVNATKGKNC